MTNKEAIGWVNSIKENYITGGDEWYDQQRRTALDLAMDALALVDSMPGAQSRIGGNMSDIREAVSDKADSMSDIRLIDASALKEKIVNSIDVNDIGRDDWWEGYAQGLELCAEYVDNAPTVESETTDSFYIITQTGQRVEFEMKRPESEWLRTWNIDEFTCAKCRSLIKQPTLMGQPSYTFCPNCGAKMRTPEDDV